MNYIMADKIQLPQSGGGLVRYSEEVDSKFLIKPETVIGLIVFIIILMIFLHTKGFGILG